MDVKAIQKALKKAGFKSGPIDGIRGRRIIAAIKAFQAANGLDVDGIVGPKTAAKLFGKPGAEPANRIPHTMPWLQEAFHLIGTEEERGAGSNEAILG
ncbi:MAG: peptidoglycan-binding domain-containing protein [Pseudomonadota bacterium]